MVRNPDNNKVKQNQEKELPIPRVLPANIQAEQILLGTILTNNEVLCNVAEFLYSEHFFNPMHKRIYEAIKAIIEKGLIATPVTLINMLDSEKMVEEIKKENYLNKLLTLSIMVINPIAYGKIIYDLALRRNLIGIGEEIVNTAYSSSLEYDATSQIEEAENKLYNLASEGVNEKGFAEINVPTFEALEIINRAIKSEDRVIGISSGFIDLDKILAGFNNSDLIILAGRPSMGKTAFAVNLALNACKSMETKSTEQGKKGQTVGFFSLEMSSHQLVTRLFSMTAQIDSYSLRTGELSKERQYNLYEQANIISKLPFHIDDTPCLSIAAIRMRAKRLKRKKNLGILFIDYLQLIKGVGKSNNRVEEISEITQGLKAIAKELDIPVIALSQLSRAVEQREDKRPILSDLRESGSIEQDADIVMFIYREEYYLSRREPSVNDAKLSEWLEKIGKVHNVAEIIIAKHRNGQIGNIQLHYDSKYSKFSNLAGHH